MAKKNMGRVKRYNHSFYSGKMFLFKRILKWALLAAAIFAVGFLVAPALLNWGTHTWYTHIKGVDLSASTASSAAVAASTPAQSEPQPAPTPTPTPAPAALDGSWATVSLSALATPQMIAQTAADLKAQGISYALVPLKDSSGYLYYNSQVAAASGSIAAATIDAAAVAAAFEAQGIIPVASLYAFQDPIAARTDRSMAIHYTGSDYLWLDAAAEAGGKPWLNPYAPTALQFVTALVDEVYTMGYSEVLLSGVQFPAYVSEKQNFGDTAGLDRAGILKQDIAALEAHFTGRVALWYEVPFASCAVADTTLGNATPDALGVQWLMITAPAETDAAESAPGENAVTVADVVAAMKNGGCTYVAVRQGTTAALA